MNNIQNVYRRPAPRTWRERLLQGNSGRPLTLRQERTVPEWIVGSSVLTFIISLMACTIAFGRTMEINLMLVSSISVLFFYYGTKAASASWAQTKEREFIKNVFVVALLIRIGWVFFSYFYFNELIFGKNDGYGEDTGWYMDFSKDVAQWIKDGMTHPFSALIKKNAAAMDDVGYPITLALEYLLSSESSDVFFPMLIKSVMNAYCALCIYHIAKRHFGESVARLSAIFIAFNPLMYFWCACLLKESEMIFLCCLSVDLVDKTFSSGSKLTFEGLLPGLVVGLALFFYRAPLAIVLFLAMFAHIVMASSRVMSFAKKSIAGVMVFITLLIGYGDRFLSQTTTLWETAQSDEQSNNMAWRTSREGGNAFAKYAGASVFAPLIFTIPFPSYNIALEGQYVQRELSGAYFIKNVFSFFVLYVMVILLISGDWRKHVFILAYTLGYLMTLVLSSFAQSGRFHMPVWPMLIMFAAYGIQLGKTTPRIRRWYRTALVIEVIACLAWNWFKLAGRGMT